MSFFSEKDKNTQFIKAEANRLGFFDVRIAKAGFMEEEARRLEAWLLGGNHGKMHYMENHFDKRVDPRKLVPNAKSVVSLAFNYYNEKSQAAPDAPKIAKYAYGKDYHFILKNKLKSLLYSLEEKIGKIQGRCFVDSAPVLERDWAKRAGLGWVGKNTLLLHKKQGSYFFLAELILDLELNADTPIGDFCGRCRRCIEACPTQAIHDDGYTMDGSKCISYLTIELREAIPRDFLGKMDNWMFGCDVCQQVCPWNRFAKPHQEPDFEPHEDLLAMTKSDWLELTEEVFRKVFKKSAVKRTKFSGLTRNIAFLEANKN